ncbi:helix-turn-helix domain-containing protein [Paenibacillus sp. EC2-1]|uniref:AraC family transcriptional regulator n=1 Tax=Paenibacillus sp. EC2-1 TaxID=3388665 RepID=UPI003BEF0BBF
MFKYFEKIQIFRKFLLSYLLILVIPLISNLIVYQISVYRITDQATKYSQSLMTETSRMIDKRNEEVENFVYQMSKNQDINQLMYRKPSDPEITYDIYKVLNSIRPYWYTNHFFEDFYIYFNNIDILVTPDSSFLRPKDFYKMNSYEGLSYEEWNKKFNKPYLSRQYFPASRVAQGNNDESIITYVQSIPFLSKQSPKANVVVLIDEQEISSLLHQVSSQYDGFTMVYDDTGNIIFNDNLDKELVYFDESTNKYKFKNNNEKYMLLESKSNNTHWTYVAAISKEKLSEDVQYIRTINMVIAMFTLFVGLSIAFLFSYKNSIPLNRLLGIMHFPQTGKVKNPYDFVHSSVEDILAKNDELKEQIQSQLPILKDTIIRKLIAGEISSSKEASALIEQADLSIHGPFGNVGIVQIIHMLSEMDKEMLDEMNVAQLLIQNELMDVFNGEILCCNYGVDQVLFIMSYSNKPSQVEQTKVDIAIGLLIQRMVEKYSLKVNVGLGQYFDQILHIHQAYEEAKLSLPFVPSIDQPMSYYKYVNTFQEGQMECYYPIELELRLINAVTNGEVDEVKELFDKILEENIKLRVLNKQRGSQLLASLNHTIMRMFSKNIQINQVLVDDILTRIKEMNIKNQDIYQELDRFKHIFIDLTMKIHEKKVAGGQQVILKMKEAVKQNFNDPNLSIINITESAGISEKMATSLFKEHVGMNLSDYLEEVRLNYAKSKLIQTDESIEDIATMSGYNSGHSFRRAFKRKTGTSPSDFKKMMQDVRE